MMVIPMGRRRVQNIGLPPRMYKRGERYYYVSHDRRWIALGADLARAKRLWADYDGFGERRLVKDLIWRYIGDCMDETAPSTRKQYRSFANTIERQWADFDVAALTAPHITQWRDQKTVGKSTANGTISLLRVAFAKAVEWGWRLDNPAAFVAFKEGDNKRRRYLTDAEFVAIRAAAPTWLALAMDLAYLTALRPIDLVRLRWSDVGERVTVLPQKTRRSEVKIAFEMTDELRAVLDRARGRKIVGLYVVATDKGRPISVNRYQQTWKAIVDALGVKDAQFRDIRGKAATDAEEGGQDARKLLHHSSQKMTDHYLKKGRTVKAEPLRRKL